MINRRTLLKAGSGSLALASLGVAAGAATVAGTATAADAVIGEFQWSRAAAARLVRQVFWLNHPEHRAMQILLESVEDRKADLPMPGAEQFTLHFAAPATPAIMAGSYELDNHETGRQLVFLQPGARDGKRLALRADFNLLA